MLEAFLWPSDPLLTLISATQRRRVLGHKLKAILPTQLLKESAVHLKTSWKASRGDAKLRAEAAAIKAEQEAQYLLSDPVKNDARLQYLERAVKRQAKQIAELQKVLKDVSN